MEIIIRKKKCQIMDIWPPDEEMLERLPTLICTSGEGFIVAETREKAGEAAYQEYKDWADYAPGSFINHIGPDTIACWHFGIKARPRDSAWDDEASSLEEWLEWVRAHPEFFLARESNEEWEVTEVDAEVIEKLGFKPGVAYCMGTYFEGPEVYFAQKKEAEAS